MLALTENAQRVLQARYLRRDRERRIIETPEELFARVAAGVAHAELLLGGARQADHWRTEFERLLTSLDFLPNTPTLMNAGTALGQLSACFVLPVEDSMEGIFGALREMALVQRTGGGTGFAFSRLRARGSAVASTGGVTPGPVSFMEIFNCATEHIKLGGKRRGANMGILRVDHPDIREFVTCKANGTALRNFNISVGATDAFMEAARAGKPFSLLDPRDGQTVGELDAAQLFEAIVQAAWRTGDPGLVFLDTINRVQPTPQLGAIEATNPCVTADTWVHTDHGPRQVRDLLDAPFTALVHGREHPATPFWPTGVQPVLRVETGRGYSLRLTANHRVQVERRRRRILRGFCIEREWVEAGDLRPGDVLVLHDHRGCAWAGEGTFAEGWLVGQMVGDGGYNPGKYRGYLRFWGAAKEEMNDRAVMAVRSLPYRTRTDFRGGKRDTAGRTLTTAATALDHLGARYLTPGSKALLPAVEEAGSDFYAGFLRGLFDADGSVQGNFAKGISIRLAQSDLDRLQVVQRMLARLGIASTIYSDRRPARLTTLPDGRGGATEYRTRATHELAVTRENMGEFARRVSFYDPAKRERLRAVLASFTRHLNREPFTTPVLAVLPAGVEKVYDCAVADAHQFDANGLVVHNCGEIPLLPYESCNLGSVNLAHMLLEREGRREVAWERLRSTVQIAVRFLDDVIEVGRFPVSQIQTMTRGNRKIGLGVMGFAEMLIRLGISYDSDAAVEMGERVMRFIAEEARRASTALAEERGVFPNWKGSRLEAQGVRTRNATQTAIAPTGTISLIAGASASIEPLFALAYRRSHVLGEQTLVEVNEVFLETIREAGLDPATLTPMVLAKGNLRAVPEVPEQIRRLLVTALEIAPERHLEIQAAFQRHVDNSVSKTVNMPMESSAEDVARIYWRAWELGLKGITIYRYGSKATQVLELGVGERGYHLEHQVRCDPTECRV